WYANHIEAVFITHGEGEIEDLATGEVHQLAPGTLYLLNDHDKHKVRVRKEIRCVCVFNPPVTGREVHDENGVYPLIAEGARASRPSRTARTTEPGRTSLLPGSVVSCGRSGGRTLPRRPRRSCRALAHDQQDHAEQQQEEAQRPAEHGQEDPAETGEDAADRDGRAHRDRGVVTGELVLPGLLGG